MTHAFPTRRSSDLLVIEEPTPELLSLVQKGGKGVRTDFPCGLEHAVQGSLDRIIGALSGRSLSACDSDYEDIHWDFTRLFIGPQAPVAPPWERSDERRVGKKWCSTCRSGVPPYH